MNQDETRDIVGEADTIKQSLTQTPQHQETFVKGKLPPQKTNISFTTLSQASIPGITPRKILGNQLQVKYVPDFYYILNLCQIILTESKITRTLNRIKTVNMHSFTLYITHSLMYVFLRTLQDSNPPSVDLSIVLNIYERSGFNSVQVPAICSHWIEAIGKYTDISTKRIFVPYLPQIATGAVLDSGFFHADVGHLIPNLYCLLALTRASATRDSGYQILTSVATQNRQGYYGLTINSNGLANSTHCRKNALRIPGAKALALPCNDSELLQVVDQVLTATFSDPVQNLLKVTPALLLQLKTSMVPLFLEIESVTMNSISPIGTSLVTSPLIAELYQGNFTPEFNQPAVHGPPAVPAMSYFSETDHASRVKSRIEIINGNGDYAYQTPVVRIVNKDEAIKIENHVFSDPQDNWYSVEHEFQTDVLTLAESRSYFRRNE